MRLSITATLDYQVEEPADLLLALEVAQLPDQRLVGDGLTMWGVGPLTPVAGEEAIGRRTWTRAEGRFSARYEALVDIDRPAPLLAGLPAPDKQTLPGMVTAYLWPSRYCESDRFETLVRREFGDLAGGDKVLAMVDWIRGHLIYRAGTSAGTTTAVDTYVQREGVCRDYAHLLIAMARAADVPARMVGAYGLGVEPQDFHAVVEVWLGGMWHLVDPSGLAEPGHIVRIGVGRDATDVSFLTIFGRAMLIAQQVQVERVATADA